MSGEIFLAAAVTERDCVRSASRSTSAHMSRTDFPAVIRHSRAATGLSDTVALLSPRRIVPINVAKVFSINAAGRGVIKLTLMKTKTFGQLVGYVSAAALCVWMCASASAQSQTNKLRVGVYDSRAIALVYGNSAAFQESIKTARAEYEKAKAAKDDKRMKEIDAQMKLQQRRLHEQGFSTGSVAGIMAKVKDSLPDVAKKAGVQVIVSKWELNHQSPDVELVDVTDELVALFHPSEKVMGWLKDVKNQPPIPIEKITDDMD